LGVAGPDADQVSNLLTLMRKMYCRVVVDLARPCQFSLGLVHRLDELPLVTSNSVSALYKAKRTIETPREKAPRMAGSG
jgi:Flp pilus assembly CpaE family ATPase